jgi:hypothetical protein
VVRLGAADAQGLLAQINVLREASGWAPLSLDGRDALLYRPADRVIAPDGGAATVMGYVSARTRHVALKDGTGLQRAAHESELRPAGPEMEP